MTTPEDPRDPWDKLWDHLDDPHPPRARYVLLMAALLFIAVVAVALGLSRWGGI